MATYTLQEQLENVQTAIAKIEGGAEEYSIAGRSVKRAELGQLYARERELKRMIARQKQGTTFRYFVVDG